VRPHQGRERSWQQERATYAGPHSERLRYGVFDLGGASACRLILRQDSHGIRVQRGAPLEGDASRRRHLMRGHGTRRAAGNRRGLPHVRDDHVEGIGLCGWRPPNTVKKGKSARRDLRFQTLRYFVPYRGGPPRRALLNFI
jgi:hypothetical protein